jgi:hypothetical protein
MGIYAFWSIAGETYGSWIFILLFLAVAVWGIIKGRKKYLYALILAWFIPLTVSLIFFTHFKFQYWLPVALPLFSCLTILLPEKIDLKQIEWQKSYLQYGALLVTMIQFGFFIHQDINLIIDRFNRAENNDRIAFYSIALEQLEPFDQSGLRVYYDYRLYVPETPGWTLETTRDLLSYDLIEKGNYDVLLLLDQRIRDYINPNVVGIDQQEFAKSLAFYKDADQESIHGYTLLFRNETGLIYVKTDLAMQ